MFPVHHDGTSHYVMLLHHFDPLKVLNNFQLRIQTAPLNLNYLIRDGSILKNKMNNSKLINCNTNFWVKLE